MSKQKVLTILGVALLIIMVIVAFTFKGKYDDASALLIAAQADAADQKAAAEALNTQLAELQAALDESAAQAAALTEEKAAAEQKATELEESAKAAAEASAAELAAAKEAADAAAAQIDVLTAEKAELEAKVAELTPVPEDSVDAVVFEGARTGISVTYPEGTEVSETWNKVILTLEDGRSVSVWKAGDGFSATWEGEFDATMELILASVKLIAE